MLEDETCPELSQGELSRFRMLEEAFSRADEELENALKRFPRRFYRYFNKPAYFTLSLEKAQELIRFLEGKCGYEISEKAAKVRYMGKVYLVAFEFSCG